MLAAIFGVLSALPEIVKALTALGSYIKDKLEKDPTFFTDLGVSFDKLNKAQTAEEHSDAASSISMLIRRI